MLAQTLQLLSRKGAARRESDIELEYEVVKCLKQILNSGVCASFGLVFILLIFEYRRVPMKP